MNRSESISKLKSEPFDLLVVGGGITGAGIALDATARGLKTALIEQNDFAYGTSSRSTKLIHGGLRYLKQLEFALVKEVGSERAVIHNLARHLVIPEKMLLPLYESRGLGSTLTSLGLKLYDWLAGVKPEDKRKMLSRKQTLNHEPLLKKEDIKGGAIYAEYRTDDARLTIEVVKTASARGALVANYCEAKEFIYEDGLVSGVKAYDKIADQIFSIAAKSVVNAAGPWVDVLREKDNSKKGKHLHLTKGVHIVLPHEKFPVKQAVYFDVGDGRMIFAIPRQRVTYVGTTDTDYSENIEEVSAQPSDATYLIGAVNSAFCVNLEVKDIESSWAGLRPLINEEGKTASELSRKDEIFESPSGLISIAGGKLTGYRKMAERTVDLVVKNYFDERRLQSCLTGSIHLTDPFFKNTDELKKYKESVVEKLKSLQLQDYADYLIANYGMQTDEILSGIHANEDVEINLAESELEFCLRHEMVLRATDFFVRRTGRLYFDRPRLERIMNRCIEKMATHFNWTSQQTNDQSKEMEKEINRARLLV